MLAGHLGSKYVPITICESFNETCIAPIFYQIVRSIMDLNLNCVPTIVDEKH